MIEAGPPIACRLNEPDNIAITICAQKSAASIVSNEMIGRFHHLGHTPTSGAQLRYPVTARTATPIAAISFAASAWALEDRDTWIGWDREARKARLQLIVGNPRFSVAPPGARPSPRLPPPRHYHRPPARRLAGPLRLPAGTRRDLRRPRPASEHPRSFAKYPWNP